MGGKKTIAEISAQSENQNLIRSGTRPLKVCSQGLFSPYLKTLRQSRFSSSRLVSTDCPWVSEDGQKPLLNESYRNRLKEVSIHSREQNYDKRQQKPDHVQGSRVGLSTLFNTLCSQTQYNYLYCLLSCYSGLSGGFIRQTRIT